MSKWTELAIRVQSIAQAGLAYTEGEYDRERYEQLRDIAAEMISWLNWNLEFQFSNGNKEHNFGT